MPSLVDRYQRLCDAIQERIGHFYSPPQNQEEEAERDAVYATILELTATPIYIPGCDPEKWTHDLRVAADGLTRRGPDLPSIPPQKLEDRLKLEEKLGITPEHHARIRFLREAQAHLRTLPPEFTRDTATGKVKFSLPLAGPFLDARLAMLALGFGVENLPPNEELKAFAEMDRTGLTDGRDLPINQEQLCGMMGEAGINPELYANGTLRPRDIVAIWEGKRRQVSDSPPPAPPAPTRKRGRKPKSDPVGDKELCGLWNRAKETGVTKVAFCKDRGIKLKNLNLALGRERERRSRRN